MAKVSKQLKDLYESQRYREGKTARDKAKGHRPFVKNTKGPTERGHLFGKSKHQWLTNIRKRQKGK